MKHKKVSTMDLNISSVGLGCWQFSGEGVWDSFDENKSIETIRSAIDNGVNFFDVAPVYGLGTAEKVLGKALNGYIKREDVIIASKCGLVWDENNNVSNNLTRESLLKEIDDSLERLNTDYIDIYQIHWPDPNTDIKETMEALKEIKASGKIKYVGVSNFTLEMTKQANEIMPINSYQGLYNLLERNPESYHGITLGYKSELEIIPYCIENGIAFLPYSPLMQGLLAGGFDKENNFSDKDVRSSNPKLNGGEFEKYYEVTEKLKQFAEEINKPLIEVAMNFLICNEGVTSVICGASDKEQIISNINATNWSLTKEQMEKLNEITRSIN